jgi:hypothetical protein
MIDARTKLLLLSAMEEAPWRRDMELARAFGCGNTTVHNYRRKLGLPLNPNGCPRTITAQEVAKVVRLKGKGLTQREAAMRVGGNVTEDMVRHYWGKAS